MLPKIFPYEHNIYLFNGIDEALKVLLLNFYDKYHDHHCNYLLFSLSVVDSYLGNH